MIDFFINRRNSVYELSYLNVFISPKNYHGIHLQYHPHKFYNKTNLILIYPATLWISVFIIILNFKNNKE
jgi:hypothetical protein